MDTVRYMVSELKMAKCATVQWFCTFSGVAPWAHGGLHGLANAPVVPWGLHGLIWARMGPMGAWGRTETLARLCYARNWKPIQIIALLGLGPGTSVQDHRTRSQSKFGTYTLGSR